MSHFLSTSEEKGYTYFSCLRKNEHFKWSVECEEAFQYLKRYLSSPPILCKPELDEQIKLYLCVTDRAISSVIVQDYEKGQRSIYYISKVL